MSALTEVRNHNFHPTRSLIYSVTTPPKYDAHNWDKIVFDCQLLIHMKGTLEWLYRLSQYVLEHSPWYVEENRIGYLLGQMAGYTKQLMQPFRVMEQTRAIGTIPIYLCHVVSLHLLPR